MSETHTSTTYLCTWLAPIVAAGLRLFQLVASARLLLGSNKGDRQEIGPHMSALSFHTYGNTRQVVVVEADSVAVTVAINTLCTGLWSCLVLSKSPGVSPDKLVLTSDM